MRKPRSRRMFARVALLAIGIHGMLGASASHAQSDELANPAAAAKPGRVTIREYIVRGNSTLDAETIEKAVYPHLGPDRTMADIEAARDALQKAYNDGGYQSVYVDLSEQQVIGGVVILQVAETKVGRVRVTGAHYHSPMEIRNQVPALQESEVPNFRLAQAQLGELNHTPDRQVIPSVKPGQIPGTMDVDLQVDDKTPWSFSAGLNNDYSADTSNLRATATISHSNLWQRGHSASITFFTAPREMADSKVMSASYSAPLSKRWSLDFSGYKSDSNVATVGDTNVLGKGHSVGVAARYTWEPMGSWSHSTAIGLEFKDFDEDLQFGTDSQSAPISYTPITLSYNGYRTTEASQSAIDLGLIGASRSFFSIGSDDNAFNDKRWLANPSFLVFKGNLKHTQDFARGWQVQGRVNFQLASGPLVSNEQFSAGGTTSVRGYYAAERTGDDGYLLGAELRTPSLGTWLGTAVSEWRFYAFAETAGLRLRDPLPEQEARYQLASVGLGTRLRLFNWFSATLDWGYPLRDGPQTEKHDPRLNFNLHASF
ncbi:ShlB/FhaC/HecB family hemolysin secretion/activation protein [Comamonas sp. GB3 AK4-5]|uniref:ShlB/FhaC/HecB family hemolysin secretion/activation protein n=1 Tax=Comamonas sp. GB3 AK4-5 TaxID=3231487 RepID=UPI00351F36B0